LTYGKLWNILNIVEASFLMKKRRRGLMKKEGIIEFISFEEKVKLIKQDREKKLQMLNERVKELIGSVPTKFSDDENEQEAPTSKSTSYVNASFEKEKEIIAQIHEQRKEISEIQEIILNREIGIENMIYRFYHSSFNVYDLQTVTERIIRLFCDIGKCHFHDLNPYYIEIVSEGIRKKFDYSHNIRWTHETRPILEAFFHSRHLFEMMAKHGLEMDAKEKPSASLKEGWASVLYLYKIR
jgi:hypothetical protein